MVFFLVILLSLLLLFIRFRRHFVRADGIYTMPGDSCKKYLLSWDGRAGRRPRNTTAFADGLGKTPGRHGHSAVFFNDKSPRKNRVQMHSRFYYGFGLSFTRSRVAGKRTSFGTYYKHVCAAAGRAP